MKTLTTTLITMTTAGALLTAAPVANAVEAPDARHPSPSTGLRHTLQQDADRLLTYGAPGALAQVRTDGGSVRVRSGAGDLRTGSPVPWRAHFRVGSFTKTFVSATALKLVGQGRLSLDDPVETWLPGVVRGHGNDGRKITVRNLLQQTSGIPDYLGDVTWVFSEKGFRKHRFDTVTAPDAVALAMRHEPVFAPGSSWGYSNTNYVLAGMVIEAVTGHPWQREVRRQIIEPLHLRHTSAPMTRPGIPRPHARAYERFPGDGATAEDPKYGRRIDVTRQNPSYADAAGAIISTTDDANRFLRLLVQGKVLPKAQLAEMTTTVPTDAGFQKVWPGSRYGLGLIWIPNSCGGSWAHGGDIPGFLTRNGVTPDGRRSVVVSLNTDSLEPDRGVQLPERDVATELIDHALCGS